MPGSSEFNNMDSGMRRNDGLIRGPLDWPPTVAGRACPDCNANYTTDSKTSKRQIPIMIPALVALVLTAAASCKGIARRLPAVVSHIILWACVGSALSKLAYVQYPDKKRDSTVGT